MTEADVLADALGGAANIHDVEPCVTRVRVEVHDPHLVDHGALRDFGALAVVVAGPVIQVVVGHTADELGADWHVGSLAEVSFAITADGVAVSLA